MRILFITCVLDCMNSCASDCFYEHPRSGPSSVIELPEDLAQSPGKNKLPLVQSQKKGRKTHQCKECEKKFGLKSVLKRHLSTVHRKEKDHHCTRCEKKFGLKGDLQRHIATVHRKEKDHQCTWCDKKFGHKSHLNQHLASHLKVNPNQCEECGKKFSQKVTLKQHMLAVHQGVKPHQCEECDMKFGQKDKLKRHMSYLHGGEKPFPCSEPNCNREFVEKTNLLNHQRSKHSYPKLACVIKGCGAKFTWSCDYKKHKKMGHGAE